MSSGNDLITPKTQLPADWADKLAQYAKETAQSETTPGNFFSTRAGTLTFNGSAIAGNKMEVCVLSSMHENVFYLNKFNPEAPASPVCYAFSFSGNDMAPHSEAEKPQSDTCDQCPNSVWGTGDGERGKACKEQRRLALLPVGSLTSAAEVLAGVVGLLRIPVTSVKHWSQYAKHLALNNMPPFAVVTEIELVPDPKTMIRFNFRHVRNIHEQAVLEALVNRLDSEKLAMSAPYPRNSAADAPPRGCTGRRESGFGPVEVLSMDRNHNWMESLRIQQVQERRRVQDELRARREALKSATSPVIAAHHARIVARLETKLASLT